MEQYETKVIPKRKGSRATLPRRVTITFHESDEEEDTQVEAEIEENTPTENPESDDVEHKPDDDTPLADDSHTVDPVRLQRSEKVDTIMSELTARNQTKPLPVPGQRSAPIRSVMNLNHAVLPALVHAEEVEEQTVQPLAIEQAAPQEPISSPTSTRKKRRGRREEDPGQALLASVMASSAHWARVTGVIDSRSLIVRSEEEYIYLSRLRRAIDEHNVALADRICTASLKAAGVTKKGKY